MLKSVLATAIATLVLAAPAGAQTNDGWLWASAPAKNRAAQVINVPRVVIIEFCAVEGNKASLLISADDNPNKPGVAFIEVPQGECVVVSAQNLYVSYATEESEKPRGYFRYRIRD